MPIRPPHHTPNVHPTHSLQHRPVHAPHVHPTHTHIPPVALTLTCPAALSICTVVVSLLLTSSRKPQAPFRTRCPCAPISPLAGPHAAHHKVGRSPGYAVALATSNENSGTCEMPRTRGNHNTQRPGDLGEAGHLPGTQGPAMTWVWGKSKIEATAAAAQRPKDQSGHWGL